MRCGWSARERGGEFAGSAEGAASFQLRASHVVYTPSTDADLDYYELEGTNGEEWNEEDAVNLGRHNPGDPNEFTVSFGLTQPDTAVALKVYVVLKSGRRAGSATMVVRRPS